MGGQAKTASRLAFGELAVGGGGERGARLPRPRDRRMLRGALSQEVMAARGPLLRLRELPLVSTARCFLASPAFA